MSAKLTSGRVVLIGLFLFKIADIVSHPAYAQVLSWAARGLDAPDPARNTLYSVAVVPGSGGSNVWAVGARGAILSWDGIAWSRVAGPTTETLRSVAMARADLGYAVGHNGAILSWDGSAWTNSIVPTDSWFRTLSITPGSDGEDAWTAGDKASIGMFFKRNVTNWINRVAGQNQLFAGTGWGVSMVGAHDGWMVGERLKSAGAGLKMQGQILRWNSSQWVDQSAPTSKLYCVQMQSATDGWIAGEAGALFRWNGSAWTEWASRPITQDLWSVHFLTSSNGWAVGNAGAILRWDGAKWSAVASPVSLDLRGVAMAATNDGWAVGVGGVILHWNGVLWQTVTAPAISRLNDVAITPGTGGSDAWAAGEGRTFFHWTGGEWQTVSSSGSFFYAVTMLSSTNGWAAGPGGRMYRWNGVAWPEVGRWQSAMGMVMLSATQGWAVGWGKIQRWDGSAWTEVSSPSTRTYYGIDAVTANDVWAVGDGGTIVHYDGTSWTNVPSPVSDWLVDVAMASATNGWIVGNSGIFLHWNGANWLKITNSPAANTLRGVSVRPGTAAVAGWAVGDEGRVYWLSNGVWRAGYSPTANDLWAVEMVSPHEAWAVGDQGVILHWMDLVTIRAIGNGQCEIDWAARGLESTTSLREPWMPVHGELDPPYRFTPQDAARFYRARQ